MNRLRPNTRIRPIRPYWSRTKVLTVVVVSGLAMFWVATAWMQRSQHRLIELDPGGPYLWRSSAGPIEVGNDRRPAVSYDASWLLFGPKTVAQRDEPRAVLDEGVEPTPVGLRCDTRFPCRASSRIDVPVSAALEIGSVGGDVSVGRFEGDLTIETGGAADVFLGPVAGSLSVATGLGGVFGFGLVASDVEIETEGGLVELQFASRPRRVVVRSGSEPVRIELPDGDYAVSVRGGSSIAINVGQVSSADSEILVQARGPVRIDPTR